MLNKIQIEIAYATSEKQYLYRVTLKKEVTVEQVIIGASLLKLHGDIDLRKNKIGIYGHSVELNTTVRNGDRIEIYRPMTADPRILRRQRIKKREEGKVLHSSSSSKKKI